MKTNPAMYLCMLALSLCITLKSYAQFNPPDLCSGPDLTVSFTVRTVNENSVNILYGVKNEGLLGKIYLNRMYIQTYISKDATLDASDLAYGNGLFPANAPALDRNEIFQGSFSTNNSADLWDYPYLFMVVKVRPGFTMEECGTTNNRFSRFVPTYFPDCSTDSLFARVSNGNIAITSIVSNEGRSVLPLSKMQFHVYASADDNYDPFQDRWLATVKFTDDGNINAPNLRTGQVYVSQYSISTNANLTGYRYILYKIYVIPGEVVYEKDWTNNMAVGRISTVPIFDFKVQYFEVEEKDQQLSLTNTSGSGQSTYYVIYSSTGEFIREGVFTENETSDVSGLKAGMYIVKLSDGVNNEAHKLIITE